MAARRRRPDRVELRDVPGHRRKAHQRITVERQPDRRLVALDQGAVDVVIGLALYGYALVRFPSVAWYHPQFNSVRMTPSRRHAVMA